MKTIATGPRKARENMDLDRELLANLTEPILHLYEWDGPSATHGHFIRPEEHLHLNHGLQLARRPTGGGIVFHTADLAFSVLIPASHPHFSTNTLENYRWVNEKVIAAVEAFAKLKCELLVENKRSSHFCMAKPTIYDVLYQGKKIGGAAQRRTRLGFLHQGTIALTLPSDQLLSTLRNPNIEKAMRENTHPLCDPKDLDQARDRLRHCLTRAFD